VSVVMMFHRHWVRSTLLVMQHLMKFRLLPTELTEGTSMQCKYHLGAALLQTGFNIGQTL
jgi:hypothetical protein